MTEISTNKMVNKLFCALDSRALKFVCLSQLVLLPIFYFIVAFIGPMVLIDNSFILKYFLLALFPLYFLMTPFSCKSAAFLNLQIGWLFIHAGIICIFSSTYVWYEYYSPEVAAILTSILICGFTLYFYRKYLTIDYIQARNSLKKSKKFNEVDEVYYLDSGVGIGDPSVVFRKRPLRKIWKSKLVNKYLLNPFMHTVLFVYPIAATIPLMLRSADDGKLVIYIGAILITFLAWLFFYGALSSYAVFKLLRQEEKKMGAYLRPVYRVEGER